MKNYYLLTKPGIIRGNLISALAGFLFASRGLINIYSLFEMVIGLSLVIASGCVFNNFIDRNIDRQMDRTKKRAFAAKTISIRNGLFFGAALGFIGIVVLLSINLLTAVTGALGFFFYVVVYGVWKRRSEYGTLVGSISGAIPPVVGYVAVTNRIDIPACLLFLVLVVWQMPHFYSIAIYRMNDYKNAGIPVLPIVRGIKNTKIQILFYICGFIVISSLFTFFGYSGYMYLITISIISLVWLYIGVKGFNAKDEIAWAKKMFGFSLLNLLVFCIMLSLDSFLHF